jgi:uncharacterized integral membrane protein
MRRLLGLAVGLPVSLIVILFSISNRDAVTLRLWPLSSAVEAPIYAVVLAAALAAFVAGGAVVWIGQGRHRRAVRDERRRAEAALRELATIKRPTEAAPLPAAESARPALPWRRTG